MRTQIQNKCSFLFEIITLIKGRGNSPKGDKQMKSVSKLVTAIQEADVFEDFNIEQLEELIFFIERNSKWINTTIGGGYHSPTAMNKKIIKMVQQRIKDKTK